MSDKTIHQIREEFASAASGVLSNFHARRDEIRSQRQPEARAYLDRLNDEQRMSLLREQMMEQLTDLTEESREAYAAEVEEYHDALSKRTAFLKESLFKVEDAGALSRAALATDTELGTLLELASTAGNKELGKAAFVAAQQRGLGNLMSDYFDKVDPEGRGLYAEWKEIPPAELLERQTDSVDMIIPSPEVDSVIPPATAAWS
jgi:hypothetical protein